MLKFSIHEDRRRKVKLSPALEANLDEDDKVDVAVETHVDHYVPKNVIVRAWIGDTTFTGCTSRQYLEALEEDDQVKSVEVARPVQIIEEKTRPKRRRRKK